MYHDSTQMKFCMPSTVNPRRGCGLSGGSLCGVSKAGYRTPMVVLALSRNRRAAGESSSRLSMAAPSWR